MWKWPELHGDEIARVKLLHGGSFSQESKINKKTEKKTLR